MVEQQRSDIFLRCGGKILSAEVKVGRCKSLQIVRRDSGAGPRGHRFHGRPVVVFSVFLPEKGADVHTTGVLVFSGVNGNPLGGFPFNHAGYFQTGIFKQDSGKSQAPPVVS